MASLLATETIAFPLVLAGILVATPLVMRSGRGRLSLGAPLAVFSIALLYPKTPIVLAKGLAALFGYHP